MSTYSTIYIQQPFISHQKTNQNRPFPMKQSKTTKPEKSHSPFEKHRQIKRRKSSKILDSSLEIKNNQNHIQETESQSDIEIIFDSSANPTYLNMIKKQVINYFDNKILKKTKNCNRLSTINLKNQFTNRIENQSFNFNQILTNFLKYCKQSEKQDQKLQSRSNGNDLNETPSALIQKLKKLLKSQYIELSNQNQRIKIKLSNELKHESQNCKKYKKQVLKLENENLSLKRQLQEQQTKYLQLKLSSKHKKKSGEINLEQDIGKLKKSKQMDPVENSEETNQFTSNEKIKFSQYEQNPESVNVGKSTILRHSKQTVRIPSLLQNSNVLKARQRYSLFSPSYSRQKRLQSSSKEITSSVFDFRPCIKLWQRQGIHQEEIDQLHKCQYCQVYFKQIQMYEKKMLQLTKMLNFSVL